MFAFWLLGKFVRAKVTFTWKINRTLNASNTIIIIIYLSRKSILLKKMEDFICVSLQTLRNAHVELGYKKEYKLLLSIEEK